MRYFENKLQDFVPGSRVNLDNAYWKEKVVSMANSIVEKMPPTFDNCDGHVYVGCAGVAYMFYYIANTDVFQDQKQELLTRARNYIDVALSYAMNKKNRDPPSAFLLGNAGAYAVGALVYDGMGEKQLCDELNKKYRASASMCLPGDYLGCGSDEFLVGRAGYLYGTLMLNKHFGEVVPQSAIDGLCQSTLHSGKTYSARKKSASPLMYAYYATEYLGAAHGLCGILQMLLCIPACFKGGNEQVIKDSVDYVLSLQQPNGNIAPAMNEVRQGGRPVDEELVHWCHGAPGAVYLFAKAFLIWKDPKYLDACLKCGEITWQKGLLKKGPGICHGVAGSGYVFLLLYRLTADEKHYHRAVKFAEFLLSEEFQRHARTPDSAYSLYEGLAGTVCFLADLTQPKKAHFPLYDVFIS